MKTAPWIFSGLLAAGLLAPDRIWAAPDAGQKPTPRPMGEIRVKGYYDHPTSRWNIALRISDPWHSGDYFLYRLPEGFSLNDRPYLQQPQGTSQWATVQPEAAPEWRLDEAEKSTGYAIRFYDGIELSLAIWAGKDEVTFRYVLRNNTASAVEPRTGSCFMLWTAPHFIDRRQERTFIWVNRKPVALSDIPPTPKDMKRWPYAVIGVGAVKKFEETKTRWMRPTAADHGLVCIQSQDGARTIGLAWSPADSIFARSTIPCVHSEPKWPPVPPGQAVQATGKLYFSDQGVAEIQKRFANDTEKGVIGVKLIP